VIVAEKLVECAIEDKQSWAFQQIADRLEGKPVQVVDATVDDNRAPFSPIQGRRADCDLAQACWRRACRE
jgi:hypothetical protein